MVAPLTFCGGGEQDEALVKVLAVALEGELGVVGELEVEIEAPGLERGEEEGVGGPDGEIVDEDEHALPAVGLVRREGEGEGGEEDEEGEKDESFRRRHWRGSSSGEARVDRMYGEWEEEPAINTRVYLSEAWCLGWPDCVLCVPMSNRVIVNITIFA